MHAALRGYDYVDRGVLFRGAAPASTLSQMRFRGIAVHGATGFELDLGHGLARVHRGFVFVHGFGDHLGIFSVIVAQSASMRELIACAAE
jgi:hypothetical protein